MEALGPELAASRHAELQAHALQAPGSAGSLAHHCELVRMVNRDEFRQFGNVSLLLTLGLARQTKIKNFELLFSPARTSLKDQAQLGKPLELLKLQKRQWERQLQVAERL